MVCLRKNRQLAVFGVTAIISAGCTATGEIDWTKVNAITGTLLHAVALNYTGPAVASVDALVAAFTGQEVQRPDQQQYPGQYGYTGTESPQMQYPQGQDPYSQYPGMQYPETQYPEAGAYPDQGWKPWGNPYPDPTPRGIVERNALSIDFALLRTVGSDFAVMLDGDRLRDGINRAEPGDRFGIVFATNEPAYVYIVNIDATGWAQTLYPYPDSATERVSVPMVGQRGLVGIVPGANRAQGVALDRLFTAPNAGELAFSRWFTHE
jgi:hypothetical protein